jgi:hypothetical protein
VASYGSGRKEQVPSRIDHWAAHPQYSDAIDRFGGDIFQRKEVSADTYRRSLALSAYTASGIRRYQTLSPQEWQRPTQTFPSQAAHGFAGGRGEEDSRPTRQFVEGIDQGIVWQKKTDRKAHSKSGYRPQDKYFSYRTAQRHHTGQQARLARRTHNGSHLEIMLQYSIWLWRDLYNWTRVHYSLLDQTPAMALGLANEVWAVHQYILYPVHVSVLHYHDWVKQRKSVLESAIDVYRRNKTLPIS